MFLIQLFTGRTWRGPGGITKRFVCICFVFLTRIFSYLFFVNLFPSLFERTLTLYCLLFASKLNISCDLCKLVLYSTSKINKQIPEPFIPEYIVSWKTLFLWYTDLLYRFMEMWILLVTLAKKSNTGNAEKSVIQKQIYIYIYTYIYLYIFKV